MAAERAVLTVRELVPEGAALDPAHRRAVATLAAVSAIVLLIGAVVGVQRADTSQRFEARTVLTIDQPVAIASVPAPTVLEKLSRLRLKYAGLMQTDELRVPIAERSGLAPEVVAGGLRVETPVESLLFVVTGTAAEAATAEELSAAAATTLVSYVEDEHERGGIPEEQRFEFRVVTAAAGAQDVRDPLGQLLPAALSALGALVALGVLVWVARRD